MFKKSNQKTKIGAASFYMVAFSTLILLIIATSFAAIMISNITRTSNDDLSQSAYDSALAGVEDAKLAFYNYQNCKKQNATARKSDTLDCGSITWYLEEGGVDQEGYKSCDMVSRILGRQDGEVLIQESEASNNMQQAYTCAKINNLLADYRTTLSSANQIRVMKAKFDKNIDVDKINQIKISWGSDINKSDLSFSNFNSSNQKAYFPSISSSFRVANPPTISVGLIQTGGDKFELNSFDHTIGDNINGTTNRGMIYLVPTNNQEAANSGSVDNSFGGYQKNEGINHIDKGGFLTSNRKIGRYTSTNAATGGGGQAKTLPYMVYCADSAISNGAEFACTTTIDLPKPIGGKRNKETFYFVLGLPYGKPETSISLSFFCDTGTECGTSTITYEDENGDMVTESEKTNQAYLKNVQIEIDSTGRANNLYRRVQARLEAADDHSISMMGPLELFGDENDEALKKNFGVKSEHNFRWP